MRSVFEDPLFEQLKANIHPSVRRCDEILSGVVWAVAINAEKHPLIPGTVLRCIKTDPFPDAPALRIYFRIDDQNTCTMCAVEILETPYGDGELPF